jgi:hypothetical protein
MESDLDHPQLLRQAIIHMLECFGQNMTAFVGSIRRQQTQIISGSRPAWSNVLPALGRMDAIINPVRNMKHLV